MQKMTPTQQREQINLMEQSLLAERFHLKVHFETRQMAGFELVIANGSRKLAPAKTAAMQKSPWRISHWETR